MTEGKYMKHHVPPERDHQKRFCRQIQQKGLPLHCLPLKWSILLREPYSKVYNQVEQEVVSFNLSSNNCFAQDNSLINEKSRPSPIKNSKMKGKKPKK